MSTNRRSHLLWPVSEIPVLAMTHQRKNRPRSSPSHDR